MLTIDHSVVGYLTGCVNSSLKPRLDKIMYSQFMKYGLLFRPGTAGFLWRGMLDTIRDKQVAKDDFIDERWPSHLHINLLPTARGTGLGSALMGRWLEQLKQSGLGCHLHNR
jgi:GNAT superfamily N-acetyltransferase